MNKRCQSCGMPFDQDSNGGGTNADGSKSEKYCSLCFQQGKFLDNFTRPEEMQNFVRAKLKEKGMGGFKSWLFSRGVGQLERWKK